MDRPLINVPNMCNTHQSLLIHQVGIPESGSWRALIIMAQIALFQGATAKSDTYERIGGDITRLTELGCLACYSPNLFGEIVDVAQKNGMGAIKTLGESWLKK